jgi:hypothetical protein
MYQNMSGLSTIRYMKNLISGVGEELSRPDKEYEGKALT